MTRIDLRFLDFMDGRPLPGADVTVTVTVVPRFARIIAPDRPDPGGLGGTPPFPGDPRCDRVR